MSIGQACKYCTHGKMRPIHFSWDQAVILCDNKKCKSILCASPSDCIIKKDLLHCAQKPFSAFDPPNLLSDGSGGSSSGIYSEARSSLPSPAQSRKSVTDEEVELLLSPSYSPLNFKNHLDILSKSSDLDSHTQIAPEKSSDHSGCSRYDGFFELLGNLDLELPTQPPNTEPHTESSVETGLDFVTAELERWMRDFEFPSDGTKKSSIISDDCQQAPDELSRAASSDSCYQFPDEVVSAESLTKELQGPCIPSHRSAFSLVDVSHEESASFNNDEQNSSHGSLSFRSLSTERNETSELIQKCESFCLSVPFVKEFVKENMSSFPTRFMSPTASAVSEDSGYNDEDGKSSSNLESAAGEENQKLSPKTLIYSSMKNVDDAMKCVSIKQSQQINFEKLIHNSLDWPGMSDIHTLTVLPAMVTTENDFTNRPRESLSVSSITQTTSSGEICVTEQDERERINFSTEQFDGGLQIPIESCEDREHVSVFSENHNYALADENHSVSISDDHERVLLENHDHTLDVNHGVRISEDHEHDALFSETHNHVLADESHAVSISESFDVSLISQSADCIVSEGSSHSTFFEPKNVSEDNANSANGLDTSNETPFISEEDKNKEKKQSKIKNFKNLCDLSVRKCVPLDNDGTVPNPNESRISDIEKNVKRRKCKISGYNYSEGGRQNLALKKGHLKKSRNREQPKRSGMACKVLPHLSKHRISSLRNQPSTSSGETLSAKNDAEELHESDNKRNLTAQNPGWQIPQGRTSRLCRRMTNLSPRKLLVGQMNRDPWSVTDLYLEEVAIEIIVQDKQEASHSDQAAKCDVQLQDLLSLFGKKQNESEISHLSTSETTLALPSEVSGEILEKNNRELPLKGRSKISYESEGKKIEDHENPTINGEQIAQHFFVTKDSRQKEHVDTHNIEQKDIATNILYKQAKGQNSSQCDIDKSHLTDMALENSQSFQKVDSNFENLSVQRDWYSEANVENSLTVEIDSNSFFSEEVGLLEQQLISNTHESMHTLSSEDGNEQVIAHSLETPFSVKQLGSSISESVHTSSLEKDNNKQIVFGGQETSVIVKQSFDKTQSETNHDSLKTESSELNMENCVIERTPSLPSNIDKKSVFELTDRHYTDGYTSDLNIQKTCEYTNPRFEKVFEEEKTLIKKLNSCTPGIISHGQFDNMDTCSSDMYPSISPEASSHYFFNNQKFGPVRSWIGDSDDLSLTGNEFRFKERMIRNNIHSKSFLDLKSEFSSSKYFQSLVEDMEVDESFLQCPVDEHPSETFFEHFKSPLFFGETASNSTVHIEVPEAVEPDFIYRDWSESSSTSKSFFQIYDQHLAGSVTSAAYTQVSHVPLPSNMALVPITSVPSNDPSSKVLSVIRKQDLGKKTIIPNNPKVTHILALPNVNVPIDGPEPSSSIFRLPSENLIPETSMAGSSGDVNVRGKKPESIKCVSEREIDTSKKLINQKQDFALECAATASSGNGTDQENCSNTEQVKFDKNSKKSGALSDCSPQDILGKESRLDVLKIKSKSMSSIPSSKEISLSPSEPLSLMQTSTSHCSAGIQNCKTCFCNLGNMENKAESTMACKEQIECQQDSLSDLGPSDLDVNSDRMPIISFDPDDEIHITIPENILEHRCNPQEKNESCTLKNDMSEKYLVDVPVDQCSINEDIISAFHFDEIEKAELSFTKAYNLGLKRKTDDEYESQKKFKLLDTTTEVRVSEYIPQNENQSPASSNSQHSLHMCGILDNSVPHDKYCCSSLHQDFEDLPDHTADKKNTQQAGKTYAGSRKLCKNNEKSKDAAVYDILKSCIAKDSTDNDYSVCSNAKETTTHKVYDQTVFDDDAKFGSVKASPQYDSHSCLRVETEGDNLSFFQLDSFDSDFLGSFLSPTESNLSVPKSSKEEEDSEHFTLLKSYASLEAEKQENIVMKKLQQKKILLNEEILHSASECALRMDNGDDLEDKRNIVPSYIPSTDDVSRNVHQFSASCEEAKPLFRSKCSSVDYKESPSFSDAIELNQALSKTSVLKGSQPSNKAIVLKSLQPSGKTVVLKSSQPFGKTVVLKSSQAVGKTILLKSSQSSSKTFVLKSSQPSNKIIALKSPQPSPSVSSHNSDKSNKTTCFTQLSPLPPVSSHVLDNMNMTTGRVYPRNQNVTGAAVPQSLLLLPPHTKENKALQPLAMTPSSFAHNGTTSSQMISSGVQKQVSLIDYQTPVPANPPTIVPPALATNNRDLSSTIAQGGHIHCPVDRIVRMVASPISHDCIQVKKSEIQEQKEKNLESYPNNGSNQETSSMLKMIKLGSNGQFYLRPSSALKNAISEMRKKKNIEDKEEKETSSGYLTLPDGNPIPHPIFIPSKKVEEVQVIKPKRKKRRKRCVNRIKTLLTEKIKESFEFNNKNEIPKVMVVYARGSFHICQIDVSEDR
ncbi:hypothetical protein O3P69_002275 [Scylla paramamosain]|uniref:Uncharacterized protein n=2 Tax=Scylla paramamosain TaxID=85552 RepID=A0AAW0V5J5_SCYPA